MRFHKDAAHVSKHPELVHGCPRAGSHLGGAGGSISGAHNCYISLLPCNKAPRNSMAQNKPFLSLMNLQPGRVLVSSEGALQGERDTHCGCFPGSRQPHPLSLPGPPGNWDPDMR